MGEGQPRNVSPITPETHTGSATATQGANTNLDPNMQGGPVTPADQAATQDITAQSQATGTQAGTPGSPEQAGAGRGLPQGLEGQSDPARTMDNSGLLRPTGTGRDAELMGASGIDDDPSRDPDPAER